MSGWIQKIFHTFVCHWCFIYSSGNLPFQEKASRVISSKQNGKITYTLQELSYFKSCLAIFSMFWFETIRTTYISFLDHYSYSVSYNCKIPWKINLICFLNNIWMRSPKLVRFFFLSKKYRWCKQLRVLTLWVLLKLRSFIYDADAGNGLYFIVCSVDNQTQRNLILKTESQNLRA